MTAPTFGKRGLKGAPHFSGPPNAPPPPRRRLRSHAVAVGAAGAVALGIAGAAAFQDYRCQPPRPGEPDARPQWCFSDGAGHSSGGGHGWGSSRGGGESAGHASFGGFGHAGSGHGGGS